MTRIAQVANFVGPTSGGLRTTLGHLADGYAGRGHEVVQIVPGPVDACEPTASGRRISLRSRAVPGTGYRLLHPGAVRRALERVEPDRLEVHDRTTLRGLGGWASRRSVGSVVVSHERLDRLLRQWLPVPVPGAADRSNAALAATFDRVVATTGWAAEEFTRLGVPNLMQVPLGVDPDCFQPANADRSLGRDGEVLLVCASRLSREKRPGLAVDALEELCRRGRPARLLVAGDGPLRRSLRGAAAGLPVELLGFVADRRALARLLASADVVLAPGPVETFGLAALEALASGTPVVANETSALGEVLGPAGRVAAGTGPAFAAAVEQLLDVPAGTRRAAARARAEQFPWPRTVEGFLAAHDLAPAVAAA